jgi:apoptosis-inducing factor 3
MGMSDPEKPDFGAGIAASHLKDGAPLAGTVEGDAVVLVRTGGRLCAVSGECTHLGAPLETGAVIDGELRCPWHHARFALETGEAVGAPAIEPLSCYSVEETDGIVRVTGKAPPARHPRRPAGSDMILIVGGGAAGHACADMLARAGQGDRVTILSADEDPPYDRTFCSKQYLAGKKDRDACLMPIPGLGDGTAPTIRTGVEVVEIDVAGHAVLTRDGERIGYGTLVLATGAEPLVPDFAGSDGEAVHVLRTLTDADALIAAADKAETIAILGASFIGLEVAASLTGCGRQVVVIAEDAVPLAPVLGEEAGRFVQHLHEEKGVRFHLGRTLGSYDGTSLTLDDGTMVVADLLVVGAGVKPRIALAKAAGLALADGEDGIRVDARLATSAETIYAIGDVASYPDPRLGHPIRVEHWVHAQRQGQHLARHLLGETQAGFGDTPFFWSGHYGTSLRYVGHAPTEDGRIEGSIDDGDFALFFREGGEEQALLTCGRDLQSLEVEAQWEKETA